MKVDKALAEPIHRVVDMLDRYVARHQELALELEQQTQLAAALTGYEQMRAASNAKVARSKIAMYEPEIELLRHQLQRLAVQANIQAESSGGETSEPWPRDIPRGKDGDLQGMSGLESKEPAVILEDQAAEAGGGTSTASEAGAHHHGSPPER